MYSYGSPHMAAQKQDDQLERTFSSYVRIQDVVLKTYLGRWTIGRSGERGSGISVLPARYDDDNDIYIFFFFSFFHLIYIYTCFFHFFIIYTYISFFLIFSSYIYIYIYTRWKNEKTNGNVSIYTVKIHHQKTGKDINISSMIEKKDR